MVWWLRQPNYLENSSLCIPGRQIKLGVLTTRQPVYFITSPVQKRLKNKTDHICVTVTEKTRPYFPQQQIKNFYGKRSCDYFIFKNSNNEATVVPWRLMPH